MNPFLKKCYAILSVAYLCALLPVLSLGQTVYTGSQTFTADTSVAYISTINNPVIGLKISTQGSGSNLNLTSLTIDASLCTNFAFDVGLVKVFYTGNNPVFSATNMYWSGLQLLPSISGNQVLVPGDNYFWICFDIGTSAVVGDTLDAACTFFTLTDTTGVYSPSITSPPGYRLVASYIIIPRKISGRLIYQNTASTGISNTVILLNSGLSVQQTTTNSSGQYQFNGLLPGTYQLTPVCIKPWGGVNAVDALAILRHFVGLDTLAPLPRAASDLDISGFVNATDALMILQRFTGMTTMYPLGDWIFEPTYIVIDGTANVVHNIPGLCTGDANRSYIPAAK